MNKTEYDYSRLKGKIRQELSSDYVLASRLGMTTSAISQRLNNKTLFKQDEITEICEILNIASEDIGSYFFTVHSVTDWDKATSGLRK